MYTLYLWNPWDFGIWIKSGSSHRLSDLLNKVKGRTTITYKIMKNDKVIRYKEARSCCWRYGMVKPKVVMKNI